MRRCSPGSRSRRSRLPASASSACCPTPLRSGRARSAYGRRPALTAALTIAIGIGATTAIFSVTNAVLLRPLPYKDPDRLVVLYGDLRARNNYGMPISAENYADIRSGSGAGFDDMAAVFTARQVLPRADGTPEQGRFAGVTTNFFRLMGSCIAVRRDFATCYVTLLMPTPAGDPPAV